MRRLALLLPLILAACIDYSEGDRSGQVTKFSLKGFSCKTWEGELNVGGMKNETRLSSDGKSSYVATVPNVFEFTVENPDMIPYIQNALQSGERVTLHYRQEAFTSPCRSDTSYFITGVKH